MYDVFIDVFITASFLWYYDPEKQLRVETDASDSVLVGILSQLFEDGIWHLIVYYSRKFSGLEVYYAVYDKELMVIVVSFRYWRHYLEGIIGVEVYTDYENLKKFMS